MDGQSGQLVHGEGGGGGGGVEGSIRKVRMQGDDGGGLQREDVMQYRSECLFRSQVLV